MRLTKSCINKEYREFAHECNVQGLSIIDNGEYWEGIILKQSLDELKTQKLQQITTWTSLAITGGFISTCTGSEVRYDSDVDTQITMLVLNATVGVEALIKRYPNGYPFRGYKKLLDGFESEKTPQYLNPEQVLQFCADLSEHIERQKQHGWELQELVKLATTSLELDSVVW